MTYSVKNCRDYGNLHQFFENHDGSSSRRLNLERARDFTIDDLLKHPFISILRRNEEILDLVVLLTVLLYFRIYVSPPIYLTHDLLVTIVDMREALLLSFPKQSTPTYSTLQIPNHVSLSFYRWLVISEYELVAKVPQRKICQCFVLAALTLSHQVLRPFVGPRPPSYPTHFSPFWPTV